MPRYLRQVPAPPAVGGSLRSDPRGGPAGSRRLCREMNLKFVGASPGRKLARDGRNRPRPRRRLPASPGCASLRTLLRRSCYAAVTGDWLSGRAPRSHRGGHWFDPSIAHSVRPAQRLLVQVSSDFEGETFGISGRNLADQLLSASGCRQVVDCRSGCRGSAVGRLPGAGAPGDTSSSGTADGRPGRAGVPDRAR
jgi:hypothetical protein